MDLLALGPVEEALLVAQEMVSSPGPELGAALATMSAWDLEIILVCVSAVARMDKPSWSKIEPPRKRRMKINLTL
jgi:hypothetical protein